MDVKDRKCEHIEVCALTCIDDCAYYRPDINIDDCLRTLAKMISCDSCRAHLYPNIKKCKDAYRFSRGGSDCINRLVEFSKK